MSVESPEVSVCIISKNEEEQLPACLRSVAWAGEIVVVDDFSTDRTAEICRSFPNVRFVQRPFDGFGFQKRFAVSLAGREWILNVDCDEVVTPELREELLATIQRPDAAGGYFIRRNNLWFGRYRTDAPPGALRLFQKCKGDFGESFVHERVAVNGATAGLQGLLLHHPKSFRSFRDHYGTYAVRYGKLAAQDYKRRGRRVTLLNAVWKIVLLPFLVFLRKYLVGGYWRQGKAGLYISFCSAMCYHIAYVNLLRIKDRSDVAS